MSRWIHEWCRDVLGHDQVRAAEDAAAVPAIQHRDLPEAVAALTERVARLEAAAMPKSVSASDAEGPENKGDTMPADGLRTERVTLELTGRFDTPPSEWPWEAIFAHDVRVNLEPGDSVRIWALDHDGTGDVFADVQCGPTAEEVARLTAERDAAIRERDEARARVAELEAAPAASGAANSSEFPESSQEPAAWGVMRDGSVESVAHRLFRKSAELTAKNLGGTVVPLYAAPPPRGWLTAEEREAVDHAADIIEDMEDQDGNTLKPKADALRALRARSTPPRVRRPMPWDDHAERDGAWIAAIRAAGGEVEG